MERQNQGLSTGQGRIEYFPCIDMAKELAMVERNAKGKQARQYSIDDDTIGYPTQQNTARLLGVLENRGVNVEAFPYDLTTTGANRPPLHSHYCR